ncbi:MAG TPA: LacI family DNA-binding transcriptional regulator [Chthoniobacteraceae bacterium]|nr:LacI family DNA-binding transcriptional regulator [Chthoniobacteraceae bacterium]
MQDVATAANVSLMTVSYALRHHPSVSKATGERVRRIAADLGYAGNPMVSSLMKQIRWKKSDDQPKLAFLSTGPNRAALFSDPFRKACFEGARHRAQSLGFDLELILIRSRSADTAARLTGRLSSRNIQGLICEGSGPDAPPVALDWTPFAACVLGRSDTCPGHHQVASNDAAMVLLAIERLKSRGYARIGFLGGAFGDGRVEDAVISTLAGYNRSTPRHPVRFSLLSKAEWNAEAVTAWVRRHLLDALIVQSPAMEPLLSASPLKVPGDLALATLEKTEKSHLAGIDRQPREIGAAAAELVVHELYENRRGLPLTRHTFLLDGRWVDGATAPAKGNAKPDLRSA